MLKRCSGCKKKKSLEQFGRNASKQDGLQDQCKDCIKIVYQSYRERNAVKVKAYNTAYSFANRIRIRERSKAHRKKNHAEIKIQSAAYRKAHPERVRQYRERYPERYKANMALGNAVRDGRIEKLPCQECGVIDKVEGHHHKGYGEKFWLVVEWLCVSCHAKTRERKEDGE